MSVDDRRRREYVGRLTNACLARDLAEADIRRTVGEARANGMPWRVIAEGLGVSTQAAWNRFHHLDDRVVTG